MDGQHALVSGQSPTFEATEAVLDALDANTVRGAITAITSQIVSAPPISPYIFAATLGPSGKLELTGHAPTQAIREKLLTRAEEISPGNVTSSVKIGSGEPLGEWQDTVLMGLDQLGALDQGTLVLNDSILHLSGQTYQIGARARIKAALRVLKPPFTTKMELFGPGLWRARHQDGALVLSGHVEDDATANVLVDLAETHYNGPVKNEMRIGHAFYADWMTTVESAMPHFAKFGSGAMIFAPEEGGFLIRGAAADSTLSYLEEDILIGEHPVRYRVIASQIDSPELDAIDLSVPDLENCQSAFDSVMAENRVLFETSSAAIDRQSGVTLDKIMHVMRQCGDYSFQVNGHTDSAGSRDRNIELSRARAEAVKVYMVSRGALAQRIDAVGFGPDVPLANNDTETGRAANRRIEFKILEEG